MTILILVSTMFKFILISISSLSQINPDQPQIYNPISGTVLQGVVSISGNIDLVDYNRHQISFNFSDSQADSWFLIVQSENMVGDGELATWDTTTIADGNYKILLEVFLNDGSSRATMVNGLRIRNYTPVETQSISPKISDVGVILQTDTTSGIPIRPFTMLNTKGNPITVTIEDFYGSLAIGAIISIILFLLVLIYSHISKKLR